MVAVVVVGVAGTAPKTGSAATLTKGLEAKQQQQQR